LYHSRTHRKKEIDGIRIVFFVVSIVYNSIVKSYAKAFQKGKIKKKRKGTKEMRCIHSRYKLAERVNDKKRDTLRESRIHIMVQQDYTVHNTKTNS